MFQFCKNFFRFSVCLGLCGGFVYAEGEKLHLKYQSERVEGANVYRNIAYARPPVGKLRWRRPVLETEPRQLKESVMCPQWSTHYLPGPRLPMQEDCLYLNIWQPTGQKATVPGQKLPVLLYIHGGAFQTGSGLHDFVEGSAFTRHDVVFVSINYRLGELGYGAKLTKQRGSLGLLDQATAIRWVEKNIAAFGGDGQRVYLIGHSKGAESVAALLSSGLAGGSVRGGIALSGSRQFFYGGLPETVGFEGAQVDESLHSILKRTQGKFYPLELPKIVTNKSDNGGHSYKILNTVIYNEHYGRLSSDMYCRMAVASTDLHDYISTYFFVLHTGGPQHGIELVNLFRQSKFGKKLAGLFAHFVHNNELPRQYSSLKPFRMNYQVAHLYPEFTYFRRFAADVAAAGGHDEVLELCKDQRSRISAGHYYFDRFIAFLRRVGLLDRQLHWAGLQ